MGKLILHAPDLRARYSKLVQHGNDLLHRRDEALDKLEEFASHLGPRSVRELDPALVIMSGGLCALIILVFLAPS